MSRQGDTFGAYQSEPVQPTDSAVLATPADRAGVRHPAPRTTRPIYSRTLVFALLCVFCVLLAAASIAWAMLRARAAATSVPAVAVAVSASAEEAVVAPADRPFVLFQHVARDEHYAKVAFAPLAAADGPRSVTSLVCERVYFAGGQGLCLVTEHGLLSKYYAYSFGPDFRPRHKIALAGSPSRARVSPDGRYGAATVFVFGHSYADGNLSTQTILIDMERGAVLGELEEFTVQRDGVTMKAPDFNFWGMTFARDSNRFYATLATNGQTFLVEGDVAARTMWVLRENVECPSLSPDNTRVAFKKRMPGRNVTWRVHVLDLRTMQETPLSEGQSVDDQAEWLDDRHILYGLNADLWVVRADGSGAPKKFAGQTLSPAVVR